MENKISLIVPVYNEEERIKKFLQALCWCDDIIIINKSSTDKTINYCIGNNVKVYTIPYTDQDGKIIQNYISYTKHDWVGIFVVSDFIDFSLASEINNLINNNISANTIYTAYKNYSLGLCEKYSPWYTEHRRFIFRKNTAKFSNIVHKELECDEKNKYYISPKYGFIYHLTHQSVDSQFERHLRYTKREADELFKEKIPLKKLKKHILIMMSRTIVKALFKKNNNSFALNSAYLMYFMERYLYVWEKYQNIDSCYENIKDKIISEINFK